MNLKGQNLIVEIKIPQHHQLAQAALDEFIDNLERLTLHYNYDLEQWGPKDAMKKYYAKEDEKGIG